MIPNEAVEAAAKATREVCETFDPGGWTEEENWAIWARRILEAAAPRLMALGLDRAADDAERIQLPQIPVHSLRHRANAYKESGWAGR